VISQSEEDYIGDLETMYNIRRKPCWFVDPLSDLPIFYREIECWCDSSDKDQALESDIISLPRVSFTFSYKTETENHAKLFIPASEYLLNKSDIILPKKQREVCELSIDVD